MTDLPAEPPPALPPIELVSATIEISVAGRRKRFETLGPEDDPAFLNKFLDRVAFRAVGFQQHVAKEMAK